eukprot:CAMPEP_0197845656 /NCGR_PEP_ID=MMETSP1438-20131217/2555_1 /TAXON_ID=1461541 /ORGANISM="Pterosperma sp., Strain CCMP1384" /LENGTH=300 /DNA_ID=CAMNT_0043457033 /DNA_START=58 /DNA_END=960 /DNA_ORIENTATION=-
MTGLLPQADESGSTISEMMGILVSNQCRLEQEVTQLRATTAELIKKAERSQHKLAKAADLKAEIESLYFHQFTTILNTKKAKIRQLIDRCKYLQQKPKELPKRKRGTMLSRDLDWRLPEENEEDVEDEAEQSASEGSPSQSSEPKKQRSVAESFGIAPRKAPKKKPPPRTSPNTRSPTAASTASPAVASTASPAVTSTASPSSVTRDTLQPQEVRAGLRDGSNQAAQVQKWGPTVAGVEEHGGEEARQTATLTQQQHSTQQRRVSGRLASSNQRQKRGTKIAVHQSKRGPVADLEMLDNQ